MSLFLFEDEPWALFLPWPDLSPSLLWAGGKPGHGGQGTRSPTPALHLPRSAWLQYQLYWQRQGQREPRSTRLPCPDGKAPGMGFGKPASSLQCFL